MLEITYEELEKATEIFGLSGIESRDDVKKRYLKLSKRYHPDMPDGSTQKFQDITKAYKILISYIDNFKFRFSKEEFLKQYPFSDVKNGSWSLW